ncbi:MAG: hypothetical protein OQK12_18640, partial [Motiliproteus sp.]|nr:hypothetical protein [Motiliproteus sp.]
VDFSALIQEQLMVNRLQVQFWKTVTDTQIALAALEAAVGIELDKPAESAIAPEGDFASYFSSLTRFPVRGAHHD